MENISMLIEKLHPLERKVLPLLNKISSFDKLVSESGLKDVEVMRALQWLSNKQLIMLKEEPKEIVSIDENGSLYLKQGLPEKRFLKAVERSQISMEEAMKHAGIDENEKNISLGILRRKVCINIEKKNGKLVVSITQHGKDYLKKESYEEKFLKTLAKPRDILSLKDEERFAFDELKKRSNIIKIDLIKERTISLTDIGKRLSTHKFDENIADKLTQEMLKNNSWKNKKFRRYDVEINVPKIYGGKRHFVNQSIEYIKKIWLDLGFKEMTGNYVQTSYWDLDALFVPQDHPARAMQDTFYIGDKRIELGKLPQNYKKIKDVHENGSDTGSTGWRYKWDENEAKKLLLRTHTTVLSAQTIAKLKKEDLPGKFFAVGRVFRNEALDWKHLFEFYQVEGIVIDPNANLKHLKGYLREFFGKMGYPDVRIRPAHFPYTEPSLEVDVLHPVKKEWIELGGAGIFRPEVVKPLLGEDIPVLAWGLGMPRIIAGYFGITDIRDLHKNDLSQIREMKMWMR